jgi:heme-degrading monooxygenase HmoA
MVLELVSLVVRVGEERSFERAFEKAQRLLCGLPGYLAHELRRSVDREQHYLLLVEWQALEHRTLGFHEYFRAVAPQRTARPALRD